MSASCSHAWSFAPGVLKSLPLFRKSRISCCSCLHGILCLQWCGGGVVAGVPLLASPSVLQMRAFFVIGALRVFERRREPKAMIGRRLSQEEAKKLLANFGR
jgi:hypothetical protein